MEHFEGSESSEIQIQNDAPQETEPSPEAQEQDAAELEEPGGQAEQDAPREDEEEDDEENAPSGSDLDDQELDPPAGLETEEASTAEPAVPSAEPEADDTAQPDPEVEEAPITQQETFVPQEEVDDRELNPYYTENIPDEPREYNEDDPANNYEYTADDLRQLEDEDPGYINGQVLDYDHPDYVQDGTHRINWGDDSVDTPHQETLEPGTRLSRVGDEGGRYLGDAGIDYDDRQLPIEEGKQPMHEYEVLKPLDVEQSTIAKQDWGPEMKNPDTQQYKTDKPVKELLDEGYLREVPQDAGTGPSEGVNVPVQSELADISAPATELPAQFDQLSGDGREKQLEALNKMTPEERSAYLRTAEKEPAITNDVQAVTAQNGGSLQGLDYRLKTPTSTYEKMYGRDETTPIGEMNDIIRYTEIFPTESLVEGTNNSLRDFEDRGYTVNRVSNTWDRENAPYRGINANLTSPDGQTFEVQFHTPESFDLKNGELHKLYEEQRTLPEDDPRAIALEDKMVELSSQLERPANIDEVKNR